MMSIIIGCVSLLSAYIRVTFSSISAERQVRTIRKKLFQSILEKDVAFFDQHQTGQLTQHFTDSINKIGKGIGEKLTAAIEMIATFISCFVVGKVFSFENSWIKLDCSIVQKVSFADGNYRLLLSRLHHLFSFLSLFYSQ